jgi:glycosyltransferase involved in cell wall biosynthesis
MKHPAADTGVKDQMSIAVDGRCLNTSHLRGIGKYLYHLIANSSDIQWTVFGEHPNEPLFIPEATNVHAMFFRFGGSRYQTWEQIGLPIQIRRNPGIQLLHCPGNSAPLIQPKPAVVTIHDTFPWDQAHESAPGYVYRNLLLPKAFRSCKAIITSSSRSASDIANHWPRLAEKTNIIPHGVSASYLTEDLPPLSSDLIKLGVRSPYLLYIGASMPRKRFDFAADIVTALDIPGITLVACGMGSQWLSASKERLRDGLSHRIVALPFVSEAQMRELYVNAVAVLYPSLKEGFGFPMLESQAVGTPVLCSKEGSVSELLGPGAIPLPAEDFPEWVHACRRLLETRSRERTPNESARRWARTFSWPTAARKTIEVYRRALA